MNIEKEQGGAGNEERPVVNNTEKLAYSCTEACEAIGVNTTVFFADVR